MGVAGRLFKPWTAARHGNLIPSPNWPRRIPPSLSFDPFTHGMPIGRGASSGIFSVAFKDPQTGIAVGCDRSVDGEEWHSFSEIGFHAIHVAPDGSVWACGSTGRTARLVAE